MKHNNNIDDLFKQSLEDVNIPDIPQAYLDDLNQKLDTLPLQKKKKKGYGFWLLMLALIGLGTAGTLFMMSDKNNITEKVANGKENYNGNGETNNTIERKNTNRQTANTGIISNNNANATNENGDSFENNNNTGETGNIDDSNESNNAKAETNTSQKEDGSVANSTRSNNKNRTKSNTTNTSASNEKGGKTDKEIENGLVNKSNESTSNKDGVQESTSKTNDKIAGSTNDILTDNQEQINKTNSKDTTVYNASNDSLRKKGIMNAGTIERRLVDSIALKEATKKAQNIVLTQNLDSIKIDSIVQVLLSADSITSQITNNTITDSTIKLSLIDSVPDSLAIAMLDSLATEKKDSTKKASAKKEKTAADSTSQNSTVKSFQLDLGSLYVNNVFTSQNAQYDNKRESEEKAILTTNATATFNYQKKKFIYSIGLGYSQWGEKLAYSATTESMAVLDYYDTTYATTTDTSGMVKTNPSLVPVYKNEEVQNNAVTEQNGVQRFSMFNIPIMLGYQFFKGPFYVTPKVGLTFGIPIGPRKGYYINTGLNGLQVVTMKSMQLDFAMFLNFCYRKNRYGFNFTPVYKRTLIPIFNANGITNNYNAFGALLGISYYF